MAMIHIGNWRRSWLSMVLLCLFITMQSDVTSQGAITIGQTVEIHTEGASLNLRQSPGTSQPILAKLPNGTRMTVVSGPQLADGYQWWEIEGVAGRGWAAVDWLQPIEGETETSSQNATTSACQNIDQKYAGIYHCTRNGNSTHIMVIDLSDPHVRFETVLGNDAVNTQVRPFPFEQVKDMVSDYPGVVAAINADYFGGDHGPEGLTVKNGERLDGPDVNDGDLNAVNRSSLTIGKAQLDGAGSHTPILVSVVRLTDNEPSLDFDEYYNVVGGGPQIVFDGIWEWNRGLGNPHHNGCSALGNDIINGECFVGSGDWDNPDKMWTVVGITNDSKLVWISTPFQNIENTLQAFHVMEAIKLDGGGSSQLWYDGQNLVPSNRPVADSLLVFYLRAFVIVEQPEWPILIQNEDLTIKLTLQNGGADTWYAGEVVLTNQDNPWGEIEEFPLTHDVSPGETVSWEWQTEAFDRWGVFTTRWQLVQQDNEFPGEPITISVIVLPVELAEKKEELERQVKEWIAQGIEDIEGQVMKWIEELLTTTIPCGASAIIMPIFALMVGYKDWYSKRRSKGKKSNRY